MGVENFAFFLVSSTLFTLTPGIDFLLILNRSLFYGRTAGLLTSFGINAGLVFHTAFAALGISTVVSQSETAFSVLKYGGACYLVLFGILTVAQSRNKLSTQTGELPPHSRRYYFFSGMTTNLFNPKVILFFLAFFPQFVSRDSMGSPWPYVVLGASYILIGVICLALLSIFASAFASRVLHHPRFATMMHKVTGVLFIVMGINVALMQR